MAPDNPNNMPRLYVENWAPTYGSSLDLAADAAEVDIHVDPCVETDTDDWAPINPTANAADTPTNLAFVDGIRRVEAWVTLDDPKDGPIPGMLGAYAVGATVWDGVAHTSWFEPPAVGRLLMVADGRSVQPPEVGGVPVAAVAIPGREKADLLAHLQERMRAAEQSTAVDLARRGHLVVADGTLHGTRASNVVGYTKTHRVRYLTDSKHSSVVRTLGAGQRTPLFQIGQGNFERFAWYLRLAIVVGGHSWTGIVRCEVPGASGLQTARQVANWTTDLLPRFASEPFRDTRAPENLVPIAALEAHLRRHLGDARLVNRALRTALATSGERVDIPLWAKTNGRGPSA